MALIHLIYVSSARAELAEGELTSILTSSVQHNTTLHDTGMLLYLNGSFMQVLEGEEAAVDETYARIRLDSRHDGAIVIVREPIQNRSFGRWSMGFKSLRAADLAQVPAFTRLSCNGFKVACIRAQKGLAYHMLERFALNQGF